MACDQFYHIFNHDHLTYCLLCKCDIGGDTSESEDTLVLDHVNSSNHVTNTKQLFKSCIPDPLCDSRDRKYEDVVNKSVFDLSFLLRNEPCYVGRYGNAYLCLICYQHICESCDAVQEVKSQLQVHLQSENHVQNIKRNVCWVYRLNDDNNFVMFHKSVVYCSDCKVTLQSRETTLLKTVGDHVLQQHMQDFTTELQGRNDASQSEVDIVSQTESLRITDNDSSNFESDYSDSDDSTESDSSENSSDDYENCFLTCPECLEYVEIYNENADFSLQLHAQKHKDLSQITESLSNEFKENADYVCPVCQETIIVFNKNIELSVNLHFNECHQECEGTSFTEHPNCSSDYDLLIDAFDSLPERFKVHSNYFTMDGNDLFCKLCNCLLKSSKNLVSACEVLGDHITNRFHEVQFQSASQHLAATVVSYNRQQINLPDKLNQDKILDGLVNKYPVIRNNSQFIEKRKTNYFCNICQKHICYSPKEGMLRFNFVLHFKSMRHKDKLKNIGKKAASVVSYSKQNINPPNKLKQDKILDSLVKKHAVIRNNTQFIEKRKRSYFCNICQKHIPYCPNEDGLRKNLTLHFSGINHEKKLKNVGEKNKKVNKTPVISTESKDKPKLLNENHHSSEKEKAIEKSTNIKNRINRTIKWLSSSSATILLNQHYIKEKNGSFFCEVCQKSVEFTRSGSQLISHCTTSFHNKLLTTNASEFMKNFGNKENNFNLVKNVKKFDAVLSKLAKVTVFASNTMYIRYSADSFVCCLCTKSIIPSTDSGNRIKTHMFSSCHRRKTYLINTRSNQNINVA